MAKQTKKQIAASATLDATMLCGIGLVAYGLYLFSPSLSWIFVGIFLIVSALLVHRAQDKTK